MFLNSFFLNFWTFQKGDFLNTRIWRKKNDFLNKYSAHVAKSHRGGTRSRGVGTRCWSCRNRNSQSCALPVRMSRCLIGGRSYGRINGALSHLRGMYPISKIWMTTIIANNNNKFIRPPAILGPSAVLLNFEVFRIFVKPHCSLLWKWSQIKVMSSVVECTSVPTMCTKWDFHG